MRLLIIIHSYYPANDPRAFRWGAICENWAQQGVIVDVVCAHAKEGLANHENKNGVNVYRTPDPSLRYRYQNPDIITHKKLNKTPLKMAKQFLYSFAKKMITIFRWPDHAWLWIPKAYRQAAALINSNNYDAVFSVAVPFSAHVVAMLLRNRCKDIPWICDYGDPFSFSYQSPLNNTRLYKKLNKFIEVKLINSSKKVSVTTIETQNEYKKHLGIPENWLFVIPPLAQKIPTINFIKADIPGENSINLIFAGTLYSKIRNPKFLLEVLSKLRTKLAPTKLKMHFYGQVGDCQNEFELYKDAINDWVFIHGMVDKSNLIDIYSKSDILVNIGNLTSYQVPSKIIEYMGTGLPILNITSIPNDSSVNVLKDYPNAISLSVHQGVSEDVLCKLSKFFTERTQIDQNKLDSIMTKYQLTEVSKSYLNLIS